jgi:hypothetical protein
VSVLASSHLQGNDNNMFIEIKCTYPDIGEPDAIFELIPVLGHIFVKVGARFNGHGAGGEGCPVDRKLNGE